MSHLLYKHLSKKQQKNLVDHLMAIAAIVHPLSAVPQVYKIYDSRDATGVSLWAWVGFMTFGLVFLSYGIMHRIKPFIVTQILWFIIDFVIVLGVLMYR